MMGPPALIGRLRPAGCDAAAAAGVDGRFVVSLFWCDDCRRRLQSGQIEAGRRTGVRPVCVAPCRDVFGRAGRNLQSAQQV